MTSAEEIKKLGETEIKQFIQSMNGNGNAVKMKIVGTGEEQRLVGIGLNEFCGKITEMLPNKNPKRPAKYDIETGDADVKARCVQLRMVPLWNAELSMNVNSAPVTANNLHKPTLLEKEGVNVSLEYDKKYASLNRHGNHDSIEILGPQTEGGGRKFLSHSLVIFGEENIRWLADHGLNFQGAAQWRSQSLS